MKRTKETYFRDFPTQAGTNELSGCREFEGEDLSITLFMQNMMPEKNSSKTNKSNGWINKSKRKDNDRKGKNTRKCYTPNKPKN